ncbi:MAG TPA: hypothetical protein VFE47_26155 [Tepidisphaeraceae bacterium]|jgi:hypothetical protein|nr:hypothetical protein [Tepidisphaeraceae bacterium]
MAYIRTFSLFLMIGVIGLFLLVGAVQEYLIFQRNPAPAQMTLSDYLQSPSPAEWVHLTNCQVEYPQAVCIHNPAREQITDLSAPVYPDSGRGDVRVILALDGAFSENTFHSGAVTVTQPIEGLVRTGFRLNSKLWPVWGLDSRLKKAAHWQLDDQYVVIDEGAKPDLKRAEIELACAILFLAVSSWGMSRFLNLGRNGRRSVTAADIY